MNTSKKFNRVKLPLLLVALLFLCSSCFYGGDPIAFVKNPYHSLNKTNMQSGTDGVSLLFYNIEHDYYLLPSNKVVIWLPNNYNSNNAHLTPSDEGPQIQIFDLVELNIQTLSLTDVFINNQRYAFEELSFQAREEDDTVYIAFSALKKNSILSDALYLYSDQVFVEINVVTFELNEIDDPSTNPKYGVGNIRHHLNPDYSLSTTKNNQTLLRIRNAELPPKDSQLYSLFPDLEAINEEYLSMSKDAEFSFYFAPSYSDEDIRSFLGNQEVE